MKTMLAVLMMSCTVFAAPPPAEVQDGAEAVLTLYNRLLGQKPGDALSSKPLDPRLVFVTGAGDVGSSEASVVIFMFGKTAFVAMKKGKGVAVVAVCGRDNIIKLADSLAEPCFFTKYGVAPVPTCGKSELKVYAVAEPVLSDYVYFEVTSQIGNVSKIEAETYRNVTKEMSDALRHYIPLSGGVLEVSGELLMSAHTKVTGLLGNAKKLREKGERNDALKVLSAARAIISEAQQLVPKGDSLSLSNQEKLLGLEFTICIFVTGLGLTEADKAADEVAGINVVRRNVNAWGKEHGRPRTGDQDIRLFLQSIRESLSKVGRANANDAQVQRRIFFGMEEVGRLEKLEMNRPFEQLVPADGSRYPWVEIPLTTLESVAKETG